jgi:NADPH2:quinone reductase
MRAWQVTALGEPADVLRPADLDQPEPGPGEVLIRVRAVGINFADVLLARGQYQVRPPLPFTPGVELCGDVVAVGAGVTGRTPGERVVASVMGALAEAVVVPAHAVRAAPEQLDDAAAAVLTVSYQTAWFALHHRARVQPGETVVVHAAAGGVGVATVQLAKAAGARVIAVVGGRPEKAAAAREAGADELVDRSTEDVAARLRELTGGRGADVVVDPVGGDAYDASAKAIALDGRIVLIGFAGGRIQDIRAAPVLVRNYSVLGLYWALYLERRPDLVDVAHAELSRLIAEGIVRPLVADTVPFEQAPSALARLAGGEIVGRLAVGVR